MEEKRVLIERLNMINKVIIGTFFMLVTSFGFSQDWIKNIEEAKELALKNDKPILLVFSGSDWCAPCMKLDKQVFSTEEFRQYATENYVLLKADFPQRKKNKLPEVQQTHNNQLAEEYNKNGFFPLVVVLNSKGKSLGSIGYEKVSANNYIEKINKLVKKI